MKNRYMYAFLLVGLLSQGVFADKLDDVQDEVEAFEQDGADFNEAALAQAQEEAESLELEAVAVEQEAALAQAQDDLEALSQQAADLEQQAAELEALQSAPVIIEEQACEAPVEATPIEAKKVVVFEEVTSDELKFEITIDKKTGKAEIKEIKIVQ